MRKLLCKIFNKFNWVKIKKLKDDELFEIYRKVVESMKEIDV